MTDVYKKGPVELRFGDWREVLADVIPDAIIADTPYSERTHKGHDSGGPQVVGVTGQATRRELKYAAWSLEDFEAAVRQWSATQATWIAALMSHDMIPTFETATTERYAFAPVGVVQKRPRLLGDGPANWLIYLMAARTRNLEGLRWGCLPGKYESHCEKGSPVVGAKPVSLMRSIVRDYSRRGALVMDPTAGGASTLIAAALEGRRAIGAELDRATFDAACKRLRGADLRQQTALWQPNDARRMKQGGMFDAPAKAAPAATEPAVEPAQ